MRLKAWLLFSVLLVLSTAASAHGVVIRGETQILAFNVSSQGVVFSPGADAAACLLSANETWAQVSVTATRDYLGDVLNIADQNASVGCQVEFEMVSATGISLLSNFTVYFGDGTLSKQVEIVNGVVTQSSGPWYHLVCSFSRCVSIAVEMNGSGASSIGLKLHIVDDGSVSPLFVETVIVEVC